MTTAIHLHSPSKEQKCHGTRLVGQLKRRGFSPWHVTVPHLSVRPTPHAQIPHRSRSSGSALQGSFPFSLLFPWAGGPLLSPPLPGAPWCCPAHPSNIISPNFTEFQLLLICPSFFCHSHSPWTPECLGHLALSSITYAFWQLRLRPPCRTHPSHFVNMWFWSRNMTQMSLYTDKNKWFFIEGKPTRWPWRKGVHSWPWLGRTHTVSYSIRPSPALLTRGWKTLLCLRLLEGESKIGSC